MSMATAQVPQGQVPAPPSLGIRHRVMRFDPNPPNCRVRQLDSYFHIYSSIVEAEAPLSDDHVAWLVRLAFREIIGQFDTTIWRNMVVTARRRPSVMTALLSPDRTIVVFS